MPAHEYKNPSLEDVEEALDLAGLFVEATNRNLLSFSSEFTLGNKDEYFEGSVCEFGNELFFGFDHKTKCFRLTATKKKGRIFETPELPVIVGKLLVSNTDDIYVDILRMAVNVETNRERKTADSVNRFLDKLEQYK